MKKILIVIILSISSNCFSQTGGLLLKEAGNAVSVIQNSRITFATDLEGNGNDYKGINNGTVTGCAFTPSQGVTFNGISDKIQYQGGLSSFSLGLGAFAISYFIKTTTTVTTNVFGSASVTGTNSSKGIQCRIAGGIIYMSIYRSLGIIIGSELNTVTQINDGNWHFITLRKISAGLMQLIVDNTIVSSTGSVGSSVFNTTSPFCLGTLGDYAAGGFFAGSIKNFSIITNVVGDYELNYLYNNGAGQSPPFNGR